MKLEEIVGWIKNHQYVTTETDNYDSSTNHYETRIYKDSDEKFYILEFMNNYPFNKWIDGTGYIRGEYCEPEEVVKKQRIIDYYERL